MLELYLALFEPCHLQDDPVAIPMRVNLRALGNVHDVGHRERVDPEDLPDPPEASLVAEALYVDPVSPLGTSQAGNVRSYFLLHAIRGS